VTLRRMQILVRDILARRAPPPPAEYMALEVNRLNEAMIVAYASMAGGNLKAAGWSGSSARWTAITAFFRGARERWAIGGGSPCRLRSRPPLGRRQK
jgi:hypothetical protein